MNLAKSLQVFTLAIIARWHPCIVAKLPMILPSRHIFFYVFCQEFPKISCQINHVFIFCIFCLSCQTYQTFSIIIIDLSVILSHQVYII